jgi:hypothetical protein
MIPSFFLGTGSNSSIYLTDVNLRCAYTTFASKNKLGRNLQFHLFSVENLILHFFSFPRHCAQIWECDLEVIPLVEILGLHHTVTE